MYYARHIHTHTHRLTPRNRKRPKRYKHAVMYLVWRRRRRRWVVTGVRWFLLCRVVFRQIRFDSVLLPAFFASQILLEATDSEILFVNRITICCCCFAFDYAPVSPIPQTIFFFLFSYFDLRTQINRQGINTNPICCFAGIYDGRDTHSCTHKAGNRYDIVLQSGTVERNVQ